jgi:anti-anti-sigma regulatory factor
MFEISEDEGHVVVFCPSSLMVSGMVECWQRAREVVDLSPRLVTIRVAGLDRFDTALLQVFLVLKQELGGGGVPVQWEGCSDEFVRSVKLLGLSEALGMVQ